MLVAIAAIITVFLAQAMPRPQEPITTIKFDCLIVDAEGVAVHATLEVEREDVITLITGDKWRFQRRMEEQE